MSAGVIWHPGPMAGAAAGESTFGGRHPGSTAENAAAGRGNPGGNSQDVCGSCPQHSLAAAATHRPAAFRLTAAPIRRKAPREHRGKCSSRARQPRGPLTGCLWDVPPASACRGSRKPPRSCAGHLLHPGANCNIGSGGHRAPLVYGTHVSRTLSTVRTLSIVSCRKHETLTLASTSLAGVRHPR